MNDDSSSWYSTKCKPLSELFSAECSKVECEFDEYLGDFHKDTILLMNNTYKLASHHVWMFKVPHLVQLPKKSTVIFSSIHKNFFVLQAAIDLNKKGLFGPARTLIRHVFEYLVLAKFCTISNDSSVFDRWESGNTVYFTKGILNKIQKPDTKEFKDFWQLMCKHSHSTNTAQQIGINWEEDHLDIYVTLCFINCMLECQYHILNSYLITKSMRSYADREDDDNVIKEIRSDTRIIIKRSNKKMGKKLKLLARHYVATWEISS